MATRVDYHEYMASREWRLKRKVVMARTDGWCERCHSERIANVHHNTYERLGHEDDSDLMGLCKPCHEFLSAERDTDPAVSKIMAMLRSKGATAMMRDETSDSPDDFMWWDVGPFPSGWYCHLCMSTEPTAPSATAVGANDVSFQMGHIWFLGIWF